ncbi:glutamine amidotransferase-related protein [Streptomyces sp. wa1064]|uniref:glutamine amidotransferase-related protein n=1 Tax=Streptomyces sp. wa1064 TaxID=1828213 RepID=UPI003C7A9918
MDAEDDFTAVPAHLLRTAGVGTSVVPHDHPGLREALRHHRGPVLLGPGPGNPNDDADPRIGALRELTAELLGEARGGGNPLVGVCLGFQLLSVCCPWRSDCPCCAANAPTGEHRASWSSSAAR